MNDVWITHPDEEVLPADRYLPAAAKRDDRLYGCTVYAVLSKLGSHDATKVVSFTNAVSPGTLVALTRTAGATHDDHILAVPERDAWLDAFDWVRDRQAQVLADLWERDTSLLSTFRAAAKHPAYRGLTQLGVLGTAIALSRLKGDRRPLWLGYLSATTGENPVHTPGDIERAAEDWREWGRLSGYPTVAS